MKAKVTRFDKIMLFICAYAGLAFSLYSLIRKSLYTTELLGPFISIMLWTVFVVSAHFAVKKQRQRESDDD